MSVTSRTFLAAMILALSALILTAGASPAAVGLHLAPALVVLFVHAWVVAVAERSCPDRGGDAVPRFPLGPRLVESGVGLTGQLILPVLLLALAGRSLAVGAGGLALIMVLSTSSLRRTMPIVLPVIGAIWAVSTMDEFHTLGDLLESARGWITGVVGLALGTCVLAGPLLRSDLGGVLTPRGRLVLIMAGLPTLMAGVLLASRPDLVGAPPDMLALAGGVLIGGLAQSGLVGLLGKAGDISSRDPDDFPSCSSRDVGLAVSCMGLVVLPALAFSYVALPARFAALASAEVWTGLLCLMLIVPAVPAVVAVAWSLDRADGRTPGRAPALACAASLLLWFVFGPAMLAWMYAAGGPVAGLSGLFPGVPAPWPLEAGTAGTSSLGGTALGGSLSVYGVPLADLARAATLMLAASAALAARSMRHAAREGRGMRTGTLVLALFLSAGLAMLLMPRLGPMGAPLAVAVGCVVMLLVDACREPVPGADAEGQPDPALG